MTDSTSTQLYFALGLLAALVLVPVLALAATNGTERRWRLILQQYSLTTVVHCHDTTEVP
jgi:hypothetical protein